MVNTNRPIKELLQLMLDNPHLFAFGLCKWANKLCVRKLISLEEYKILYVYIQDHKPIKWFWEEDYGSYYWKSGEIKPRIKWLKKHIKKLKKQ